MPLAGSQPRRNDAPIVTVPPSLPVPRGTRQSTQEAFGRHSRRHRRQQWRTGRTRRDDLARRDGLDQSRAWVNRRGIFDRAKRADTFRDEKDRRAPSAARNFRAPAPSATASCAAYSRARTVASRCPCTITCEPTSVSGLSRTGFMSVCGSTPAGQRLQRLRAADLAAVDGDGRIVRHVLRLERRAPEAAPRRGARQAPPPAATCPRWSPRPGSSARACDDLRTRRRAGP